MTPLPKPRRLLLKISGEVLLSNENSGIDPIATASLASHLQQLHSQSIEIALVIGGGNLFRGETLNQLGMERSPADQIGLLATIMNGIALQQALNKKNCPSKIMSGLDCPTVVERYNWQNANKALSNGKILLFVGGTGNPYFTTDSAAALRACEIKADYLLKATKVDGVYDRDPRKDPNAKCFKDLTYSQALADNLQVMDATAIALCRDNQIPIFVFNMQQLEQNNFLTLLSQRTIGTLVQGE